MKRWHITAAVGVGIIALLFAWRATRSSPDGATSTAKTVSRPERSPLPKAHSPQEEPSNPLPEIRLQFDDDPFGNLRLEGQVIDSDELPVGDALVAVSSNPARDVKTGQDGSFVFDHLVGHSYVIEAFHDGRYAGPINVRLTSSTEPVILRLKLAASLEVSVVDAHNYEPIEGATVTVSSVATITSTTNHEGKTTVRGLGPGSYLIRATATRYGPAVHRFTTKGAAGVIERRTIALRSGALVLGSVRDPSGRPVEGAKVAAIAVSSSEQEEPEAVTDRQGRWRLEAISAGTYRFRATHGKHAPGLSEPVTLDGRSEQRGVEIQLRPGGRVTGQVVSTDGTPVGFAAVRVHTGRLRQAFCDEHGEFHIEGLPREKLEMVAVHETATSAVKTVDLSDTANRDGVRLTLDIDGMITGIVVNAAGEEVPEAEVRAFAESSTREYDEWSLRQTPTAITDYGGGFVLRGLPSGTYSLNAHRPGEYHWFRTGSVKAKTGDRDVRVVLQENGSVTGKVLYEEGTAPDIFFVQVGAFAGKTPFSTKNGSFRVTNVPPRTHTLFITGPGFRGSRKDDVKVDRETNVGTIIVKKGRSVRGRVLTEGRSPVKGATVVIGTFINGDGSEFKVRFGSQKTAITDENGLFSFAGLRDGALISAADHPEAGRSPVEPVPEGDDVNVELIVVATGALQGNVKQGGKPLMAHLSAVQADTRSARFSLDSSEDGFYRFDRLVPGRYQVNAQPSGSTIVEGAGGSQSLVEIESGKTTTLDFDLTDGATVWVKVATKDGHEVESAAVLLVRGKMLDGQTVGEYKAALAELEDDDVRQSPMVKMLDIEARFENVEPDNYAICAWALPKPKMIENGVQVGSAEDDDPAACKTFTVRSRSGKLEETIVVPARPSD